MTSWWSGFTEFGAQVQMQRCWEARLGFQGCGVDFCGMKGKGKGRGGKGSSEVFKKCAITLAFSQDEDNSFGLIGYLGRFLS